MNRALSHLAPLVGGLLTLPAFLVCFFSFLSKIRGEGEVNEAIHEELHPLNLKRKYDDNRNLDIVILNEPYPKP